MYHNKWLKWTTQFSHNRAKIHYYYLKLDHILIVPSSAGSSVFIGKGSIVWNILNIRMSSREVGNAVGVVWKVSMEILICFGMFLLWFWVTIGIHYNSYEFNLTCPPQRHKPSQGKWNGCDYLILKRFWNVGQYLLDYMVMFFFNRKTGNTINDLFFTEFTV